MSILFLKRVNKRANSDYEVRATLTCAGPKKAAAWGLLACAPFPCLPPSLPPVFPSSSVCVCASSFLLVRASVPAPSLLSSGWQAPVMFKSSAVRPPPPPQTGRGEATNGKNCDTTPSGTTYAYNIQWVYLKCVVPAAHELAWAESSRSVAYSAVRTFSVSKNLKESTSTTDTWV